MSEGATERGAPDREAALGLLCRLLNEQRTGVLSIALDVLPAALGAAGAIAYGVEGRELGLVAETGLPRKAKPWLARLPLDDDPWFVAQRVALTGTSEVASEVGGARDGHPAQAQLAEAGWPIVAALPIGPSRAVRAVLVLGGTSLAAFDAPTRAMLDAAAAVLALALGREDERDRRRDETLSEARTTELATVGWLASAAASELAAPLGRLDLQLGDERALFASLRGALDALRDADEGWSERLAMPSRLLDELIDLSWDLRTALREARAITSQLLAYSEDSKLESLDLGEIVTATVGLLRGGLARRALELEHEHSGSPLLIIGRRDGVSVLIVQLLQQAARLCKPLRPGKAVVRVTTSAEPTGHVLAVEWSGVQPGAIGTGKFDAFLNPRVADDRAEIGLALARRTVLAHNGHIELGASELGGGLIRVVFPGPGAPARRERDYARRPVLGPAPGALETRGTVVWIDRDEGMARTLSRALPGYVVRAATSGGDARILLASLARLPDLVLCDLGMDDGVAVDLHREADPALAAKFVFSTGGVISRDVARYVVSSGRPTLIKPVAIEEIAALLGISDAAEARSSSVAPTLSSGSSRPPEEPAGPSS